MGSRRLVLAALLAVAGLAAALTLNEAPTSAGADRRPWPLDRLHLGMMDTEGGATALAASAPLRLRYHYLAGGINTGNPWQTWGHGDGRFVTDYVNESRAAGMVPVFSYYEMRQSQPGASNGDEAAAILTNLRTRSTMRAYYENLRLLFQRLREGGPPAVVHVEPDLWGYVQQRRGDHAAKVPAEVASTGLPELKGLPNTVSGFARAILRLRNQHAPDVLLGYSLSIWGTGKDIAISNEPAGSIDALAARAARFYKTLNAPFDAVFAEFNDRTSGYAQNRDGRDPDLAWWDRDDFARHTHFLHDVHDAVKLPIVLWQIPLGNTVMRSMDNSPRHYQDNRVQRLLDPRNRYRSLRSYANAGVVALLFGPGLADDTHATDFAQDGVTNPSPITTNRRQATSPDDDGGYFRAKVREYARNGPLRLSR